MGREGGHAAFVDRQSNQMSEWPIIDLNSPSTNTVKLSFARVCEEKFKNSAKITKKLSQVPG